MAPITTVPLVTAAYLGGVVLRTFCEDWLGFVAHGWLGFEGYCDYISLEYSIGSVKLQMWAINKTRPSEGLEIVIVELVKSGGKEGQSYQCRTNTVV